MAFASNATPATMATSTPHEDEQQAIAQLDPVSIMRICSLSGDAAATVLSSTTCVRSWTSGMRGRWLLVKALDKGRHSQHALVAAAGAGDADVCRALLLAPRLPRPAVTGRSDPPTCDSPGGASSEQPSCTEVCGVRLPPHRLPQAPGDSSWALVRAASRGHLPVCRVLLEEAQPPAKAADRNSEALLGAVLSGASADAVLELARLLMSHGAEAGAVDSQALVQAASQGSLPLVELLLGDQGPAAAAPGGGGGAAAESSTGQGARPSRRWARADAQGSRALVEAAQHGHTEVCRVLLLSRPPAQARDRQSLALVRAAGRGHLPVCKLLLEEAHPPARAADHGSDALVGAVSGHAPPDVVLELAELLVRHGAWADAAGGTALVQAAAQGSLPLVNALLLGVPAAAATGDGQQADAAQQPPLPRGREGLSQALQVAAAGWHVDVCRALLAVEAFHKPVVSVFALLGSVQGGGRGAGLGREDAPGSVLLELLLEHTALPDDVWAGPVLVEAARAGCVRSCEVVLRKVGWSVARTAVARAVDAAHVNGHQGVLELLRTWKVHRGL